MNIFTSKSYVERWPFHNFMKNEIYSEIFFENTQKTESGGTITGVKYE